MANILSRGQHVGVVTSDTYQIPAAWVGELVYIEVDIPANENVGGNSLAFTAEISDNETGPFEPYGGFTWQGGNIGRDGTWNPARAWPLQSADVGRWVRATLDVPVQMRCGIDIDVSV